MKLKLITNPIPERLPVELGWFGAVLIYAVRFWLFGVLVAMLLSAFIIVAPHPPVFAMRMCLFAIFAVVVEFLILRKIMFAKLRRCTTAVNSQGDKLQELLSDIHRIPDSQREAALLQLNESRRQLESLSGKLDGIVDDLRFFPFGAAKKAIITASQEKVAQLPLSWAKHA
ncbi:MAG TPA: hypothetical protein VFC46_07770 [Humisphaera sp.]|nr:hypothetical protein [Humisphaera sp.]